MEIRKIKINEKEFEFVNESRNTRSGFAHDSVLFINGYEEAKHTCHYLNRTWECYRYQTVMVALVSDLIHYRTEYLTRKFKEEKGYEKLTANRKEELKPFLENDSLLKEYKAVKDCLHYQNMNEVKNLV